MGKEMFRLAKCSVSAADKKREREVHLQVLLIGNSRGSVLGNIILRNIIEHYLVVFATMHMKVKVKLTLEQAMKAQRGSRVLLFL